MVWKTEKLGNLCTIKGGGTPSRKIEKYYCGRIPWATVKDFTATKILDTQEHITEDAIKNSASNLIKKGSILVVTRMGLGKIAIAGTDLAINQDVKALSVHNDRLDTEYLFWFLLSKAKYFESVGTGATVKGIKLDILTKLDVPVPPLSEQKRIVEILKRAEGIIRLRKEQLAKTRALIPALFIDMFGDPATNPKGWDMGHIEQLGPLDRGKSKHRPRDTEELYGGPYPFIQTGDVANSGGIIEKYNATYSDLGLKQSRLWPKDTLCITIAANIAKTGILQFDACFPDSVVGFLPKNSFDAEYIQGLFWFLQPLLEQQAPQAAQKNINLKILRDIRIPIPDEVARRNYSENVISIRKIIGQQESANERLDELFQSLLCHAFQGALTISAIQEKAA